MGRVEDVCEFVGCVWGEEQECNNRGPKACGCV